MKIQSSLKQNIRLVLFLITLAFGAIAIYCTTDHTEIASADDPSANDELPAVSIEEAFPHVIEPRTTLFNSLRELDISPAVIQQIVDAAKPVQNLAQIKPGIRFQLYFDKNPDNKNPMAKDATPELSRIQFRFSAIDSLNIEKVDGVWKAEKVTEQVDIKVITYSGNVTSSLWESAQRAKMDPNLISELADIFGWEVDFAREVRVNDRWRLTVEEKMVKGQNVGWGAILAAEYENAGTPYRATLFRLNGEEHGYFTPEGLSLRKMFLKSPVRYGRITSGFSTRRFHPILKFSRPHLGVDYAAPTGTPIRAVGEGTVFFAGWAGGGGKVVKIRHNSTYQTMYKHMKGFAKGVRSGAHVQQGQVIGYVGTTGLSTGPHVHFEFYQSGKFVDPLKKSFPSSDPVPKQYVEQFKAESAVLLSALPPWNKVEVTSAELSSESTKKN